MEVVMKLHQVSALGLFLVGLSCNAANYLPKDAQLSAAVIKSEAAGNIAKSSVDYFEQKCGTITDEQTAVYLDSDYHAMLVVLNNVLPPLTFDSLHNESLAYYDCGTTTNALNYLKSRLNIQ